MIRWLFVMCVMMVGCVATIPPDDSLSADIACEAAREVMRLRQMRPEPAPTPAECCKECKGTGFITHGDGHRTPCPCPPTCACKKAKAACVDCKVQR